MNTARSLLLAATTLLLSCGDPGDMHGSHMCTEMGCYDVITLELGPLASRFPEKGPISLHVCVDSACWGATITGPTECSMPTSSQAAAALLVQCATSTAGDVTVRITPSSGQLGSTTYTVAVAIEDGKGVQLYAHATQVTPQDVRPNGPMCEPACHQATVVMRP